jgi:hypothetical protein
MNAANGNTFVVNGSQRGRLSGTYSGGGTATLSFDPDNDFKPGEEAEVTLTTGLTTTGGSTLDRPFTYRFRGAVTITGGNGTFTSVDTVGVGSRPATVTAGDWDGDGDLDLAVANRLSFDVTILVNDGMGSFSEPLSSPVDAGSQPSAITAGDWDGDGDLDLAVTRVFTFDVTILLNDGTGVFVEALSSPVDVGSQPSAITAGDWDGDGDLDLAVANQLTFDVTVLLNNGTTGTGLWLGFSQPSGSPIGAGDQPSAIVAGDWDGDGDLDLAVANRFTFDVTILLNNGTTTRGSWRGFTEAFFSPVIVGSQPSSMTAGDWDGDGDLDLAVANQFTFDVTVLLNDGTGVFVEALSSPVDVGSQPSAITSGDWDGDGDLDLAVANGFTDNVTVLLNNATSASGIWRGFIQAPVSPVGVGSRPSSLTAGDWDGEGDLDLAVANEFTNNVTLLQNGI